MAFGSSAPPLASNVAASSSAAVKRGARAISSAAARVALADPFAGAVHRALRDLGHPPDDGALVAFWRSRAPGNPRGEMRYRWELSHRRGAPLPAYAPAEAEWSAWRSPEGELLAKDPFAFEERLTIPLSITENVELLSRQVGEGDSAGDDALSVLRDTEPVARRDFARCVQALDPWSDTFTLWCLVRRPANLERFHPLAVAIATCYAAGCEGPVLGIRYPFHQTPLASASAHLGGALLALGSDVDLAAELIGFVSEARLRSGGWGDASDEPDVLTTLVAADLVSRVDPAFDPAPTVACLEGLQSEDGLWRALGPDAIWTSWQILAWFALAAQPFALRFRWPHVEPTNLDHKTRLPFYAYFADLAGLFRALPGLSQAEVELAFIDLIGFRDFNNRYGQERGDDVLRFFATVLTRVTSTRAIRDGGDEFLVVAAPKREPLAADLEAFRRDWPGLFAAEFGSDVPPVAPRILTGRARGNHLVQAREVLGRGITDLKRREATGPDGILVDAGRLS